VRINLEVYTALLNEVKSIKNHWKFDTKGKAMFTVTPNFSSLENNWYSGTEFCVRQQTM